MLSAAILAILATRPAWAAPREVGFAQSATTIEAYDFVEVTLKVDAPGMHNPFLDATVQGHFEKAGGADQVNVEGFCDSANGTVYRIRFMPSTPGDYSYAVNFRQGDFSKSYSGSFTAVGAHRRGIVRVDPKYPWHFIWEGTGEHYFLNGTTAFLLMGWKDEKVIQASIDRLHRLKINRVRVLLAGRPSMSFGASRLFLRASSTSASIPG